MSDIKAQKHEEDSLITERDIDDEFGLFQEDSFPEALRDKDQKEAINHAILKEETESYEQPNADWEIGLTRDELLESDAILAAGYAGLTDSTIDLEDVDTELEDQDDEELPLEDVPDADDIEHDSPVDPASPPLEIVHGTDLLNGSQGE